MPQRIAHGLRQVRDCRYTAEVILQPGMQSLDNRPTSLLPHLPSVFSGMTPDLRFDRVELADACEHVRGER
jgi:hypothetical protein